MHLFFFFLTAFLRRPLPSRIPRYLKYSTSTSVIVTFIPATVLQHRDSFRLLSARILHFYLLKHMPISPVTRFPVFTKVSISFSFLPYNFRLPINIKLLILGLPCTNKYTCFILSNMIVDGVLIAINTNEERESL